MKDENLAFFHLSPNFYPMYSALLTATLLMRPWAPHMPWVLWDRCSALPVHGVHAWCVSSRPGWWPWFCDHSVCPYHFVFTWKNSYVCAFKLPVQLSKKLYIVISPRGVSGCSKRLSSLSWSLLPQKHCYPLCLAPSWCPWFSFHLCPSAMWIPWLLGSLSCVFLRFSCLFFFFNLKFYALQNEHHSRCG